MDGVKRQRQDSGTDIESTKRRSELPIGSHTHFEDLPNEVLYEILDFLEVYQMHIAFLDLNRRFRSLLTDSTVPIKINLSAVSKSIYDQYYEPILRLQRCRISFLRISNLFTLDFLFPSIRTLSKLTRLQTLSITNLQANYLGKLLKHLASLPHLSSLTLILTDDVDEKNKLYRRIFRLPALKYCKLSLVKSIESDALPMAVNPSSGIKHLVLNNGCDLQELVSLLSYVPRLRRLSLVNLYGTLVQMPSVMLDDLTDLSISKSNLTFDEFELLIQNHFRRIEVLHFSRNFDDEFLNAKRWEQLIAAHLLQLRVFDVCLVISAHSNQTFEPQLHRFQSPFWLERKWFFSHQISRTSGHYRLTFYSTKPYRRRYYTICGNSSEQYASDEESIHQTSVRYVRIENELALLDCNAYFPNARELTFSYQTIDLDHQSLMHLLNRTLPLQQLTKLVIDVPYYHSDTVVGLLCSITNIHTLVLNCTSLGQSNFAAVELSESFQWAAATNQVTTLILLTRCTFETIELLVHLCSQLQHLTVNIYKSDFEATLRFLWSKDNEYNRRLFSLHLKAVHDEEMTILNQLLQTEKLLDQYYQRVSESNPDNVYVWWQ